MEGLMEKTLNAFSYTYGMRRHKKESPGPLWVTEICRVNGVWVCSAWLFKLKILMVEAMPKLFQFPTILLFSKYMYIHVINTLREIWLKIMSFYFLCDKIRYLATIFWAFFK